MTKLTEKKIPVSLFRFLNVIFIFILVFVSQNKLYTQDAIQGEEAVKKYGWGFDNFSDTLLSWDIYCHSFFGIPTNGSNSWITDVFDKAYYETAFKTVLPAGHVNGSTIDGGGNCLGISLLSLMMNKYGGYLGFCAPPLQYGSSVGKFKWPTYPGLKRAINIMHGHQLGLAAVQSFIDQFHSGHSADASYGVTLAIQAIEKEGPCLVCINRGILTSDGHAMIAYKVTDEGSGNYKIWIIDPNRHWPKDSSYYKGAHNFIQINGSTWSFLMAGRKSPWPTDHDKDTLQPLTSGTLVIYPVSVIGPTQRTPSSMGVSVLGLLAQICIWGNSLSPNYKAEVSSIGASSSGNTFIISKTLPQPVFEIPRGLKFNFKAGVYPQIYPLH